MNKLCFSGATYSYSSYAAWRIDFSFLGGIIYQLIGGNGSGKSTIGRISTGILSCTNGDAWLNGQSIRDMKSKEKQDSFFYIPQEPHWSFVGETFCNNLRYFSKGEKECRSQNVAKINDPFYSGLRELVNKTVFGLSSEEVFLLALWESSIWERTVLFIDECPDLHDEQSKIFFENTLQKRVKSELVTVIAGHMLIDLTEHKKVDIIDVNRFKI